MKRMAAMCLALDTVQAEWIASLNAEIDKADPSKEKVLSFPYKTLRYN
jgi:hypothetical protein